MPTKYLVIGAQGQLGRDLCPRLAGEVIPAGRDRADLTRPDLLRAILEEHRPQIVVNCAAYNLVDKAESEPDVAFAVNAFGPRSLATLCAERDITFVHFSTDYVFGLDTARTRPWTETDVPGPVSVYGASKLAGEFFVRSACPKHVVIRTCGLYGVWGSGGKGTNFVETMLRLAAENKPVSVVDDQRCTPTYTADLADAVAGLISAGRHGLFHITNSGDCTWYELAAAIFEYSGVAAKLSRTSSSHFPRPARRPAYSVLSGEELAAAGVRRPRPWRDALRAYLVERRKK